MSRSVTRFAEAALLFPLLSLGACQWPSDSGTRTGSRATDTTSVSRPAAAASVISVRDTVLPSGSATLLTLRLRDSTGAPIIGAASRVRFSFGGGSSTGTIRIPTEGDGDTYYTTFTGVIAGTPATIGAVLDRRPIATSTTGAIRVTPGPLSLAKSVLEVSPSEIDSGETATLSLRLQDAASNPLASGGLSVEFTAGPGGPLGTIGATTDHGNGSYSATFTASAPGSTTIGALVGGKPLSSAGQFLSVKYHRPPAPEITIMPRGATLGSGSLRFSAAFHDAAGNVVPGKPFTWTTLNPFVARIDASTGEATANATNGQVVISASADGITGYAVLNVVGEGGQVASWTRFRPPLGTALCDSDTTCPKVLGTWGTSPDDYYAVGTGGVYHFSHGAWQNEFSDGAGFIAVWGSGPNDVFVVGSAGLVLHNDGAGWSRMSIGTTAAMTSMWGSAPNDVYATSASEMGGSVLWHYDGHAWTPNGGASPGTSRSLNRVWGLSAVDIYASGPAHDPYHFDGTRWSVLPNSSGVSCETFWGTSPSNIYCASGSQAWRFDGGVWTALNPPMSEGHSSTWYNHIWGTSEKDVYIVGYWRELLGFDGVTWRRYATPAQSDPWPLYNVWSIGGHVFAVGIDDYHGSP